MGEPQSVLIGTFLKVEDLAVALGIGARAARKMLERGELPGFRLGRRWYCRPADLDAHLSALVEEEQEKRAPGAAARILAGLPTRRRSEAG